MTKRECEFEPEVLACALQGRWDEHLRAHADGCPVCADVAAVAEAIDSGRGAAPAVPDSGRVWWMAQHRARLEAAQSANRPMTAAYLIAAVCAGSVLISYLPDVLARVHGTWAAWAAGLLAEHGALALGITAVLFLLPAAAILAIGRE
jgi:hypothetical protein